MDIMQNPMMQRQFASPIMPQMMQPQQPDPNMARSVAGPMQAQQQRMPDPRQFDTPEITMTSSDGSTIPHFSVIGQDKTTDMVVIDNTIAVPGNEAGRKKRGRPPKKSEIIRPSDKDGTLSGTVEEPSTAYSYMETTDMLRETLDQIDSLNGELVQEFSNVKANKYIKNKYNTMIGLSENIGSLLSTKIAAIREINSSISKANDLDYKKMKDINAMQQDVNDDQYVANMYKSFISNPQVAQIQPQFNPIDQATFGSGIIRADLGGVNPANSNGPIDVGYLNYMSNLSPEQNMMRYENDPNVKQVVVWDKRNNAKFFQMMRGEYGPDGQWHAIEAIPNVPVYDQMFMEDTTIDVKANKAKNLNLRETFELVIINDDGVTSEY